jgi:hypothetical protein
MAAPYYIYGGNLLNREKFTSVVNTAFGQRRYFSSIDTDVYFGDVHIDEMVAFDFIIEEKKIPIFGYNNFTPKRLLTGQKSIQGSFAINFTQTFNLKYIIDGLADSIYANEYEETQFYCADDNKALFGKGFDITLSYGDAKGEGSYNACTQTLVGCYITSYRQAFDTSGEPILDMYTFIAKDLIVSTDSISTNEVNKEDATKNDDKTWPEGTNNEYIANGNDSSEQGARRYYSEHKNEDPVPICIDIAPVFVSDTDNPSYKISTTIELINNLSNFTIDFCKVTIIDDELKQYVSGLNKPVNISTTYSLEKDNNNGAAISYYSMTLPNGVGNAINKYLESTNGDYVECEMEFSYSVTRDGQSCTGPAENPKKTKLYFGNKLQKVYTTNNDSMITESKTRN